MKTRPSLALVCAGPIKRLELVRLTNLKRDLTWIKSSTYRAASRTATELRAGVAVRHYEDFREANVIVVSAPAPQMPAILTALSQAAIDWPGKVLSLASADFDTGSLSALERRGAAVATFAPIALRDRTEFVLEGAPDATRVMRRLLHSRMTRVTELGREQKAVYLAGAALASATLLQLMRGAALCLQNAGLEPGEASRAVERWAEDSVATYRRCRRPTRRHAAQQFLRMRLLLECLSDTNREAAIAWPPRFDNVSAC